MESHSMHCLFQFILPVHWEYKIIIIIIRAFVRRTMSASELNLKRRVEHPKIQSDSYTVTCCLSVPEAVQLPSMELIQTSRFQYLVTISSLGARWYGILLGFSIPLGTV